MVGEGEELYYLLVPKADAQRARQILGTAYVKGVALMKAAAGDTPTLLGLPVRCSDPEEAALRLGRELGGPKNANEFSQILERNFIAL